LMPILYGVDLLGVIAVGRKRSGDRLMADDRMLLRTLANQSSIAIENAKAFDEIAKLNETLEARVEERTWELRETQAQLTQAEKMKSLGQLVAGVAHELNNPINNITLTAEMLKEDYTQLPDAERLEMVQDLIEQAERSQKIVRNLLDYARESEMTAEHLNVKELLDDSVKVATNQIKLARVKVVLEVPQDLPRTYGDRQQLRQVILNLVLNALDAMPGGGTLTLAASVSDERDYLEIRVTDTGAGIPPHVLPKIFDPFFTTKPSSAGTGLGLAVSLGIVRQHGGDIHVRTEIGKGTCFTVLLPIAKIPAQMDSAPTN
jgi:two-component system NtrC family sensor kinase